MSLNSLSWSSRTSQSGTHTIYLPGPAMSKKDTEHYNEFVSDKVSDASDDVYTVLTTESYNSHQHIDALHVFTPHLKIHPATSKRFRKIYEANLLNDYKT